MYLQFTDVSFAGKQQNSKRVKRGAGAGFMELYRKLTRQNFRAVKRVQNILNADLQRVPVSARNADTVVSPRSDCQKAVVADAF